MGYAAHPSIGVGTRAIAVDPTGNYAGVLVIFQAVSSTGYVSISYFVAAVKRMRSTFASPALAPVLIGSEVLPGEPFVTDGEILAYLRKTTYSMSHGFATCKMGKPNDIAAVVDTHGRVYGVKILRVIDGSIFPFRPPEPSPQTQVYILAENLAQDIKDTVYEE